MDNNINKELKAPPPKKLLNKIFQLTIPLALGIVILYFLYRDTDFNSMWAIIKNANWAVLAFSLIFGLTGNVIRGLRWELLINPLGYYPKKSNLIYAVLGNYAVNFALPRAGEIWRCGIISKNEKIPFKKLIGTLIIDRIFDTLMVFFILLLAIITNFAIFLKKSDEFNIPSFLTSEWFYILCIIITVTIIAVFIFFKDNSIVRKTRDFIISIWLDIKTVWKMRQKQRFFAYTFGIWIAYFLYFFITFYAFNFTINLGFAAGLFIFGISSVSMAIPSNGGLGPWQAAIVFGLTAFAVNVESAKAFATAVFAFQSIWVVLCGLYGIVALMIKNDKN